MSWLVRLYAHIGLSVLVCVHMSVCVCVPDPRILAPPFSSTMIWSPPVGGEGETSVGWASPACSRGSYIVTTSMYLCVAIV